LPITDLDLIHQIREAFIEGAETLGISRNPDYNSGDRAGTKTTFKFWKTRPADT